MADAVKMRSFLLPGPFLEETRRALAPVACSCHMVSLLKTCPAQSEGHRSPVATLMSLLFQIPPWAPLDLPKETTGLG